MKKKAAEVLAFAPHPLDIEMGMGGTIARLIREGKNVVYVICTNGDKASSDPNMMPQELDNPETGTAERCEIARSRRSHLPELSRP